MKDVSLLADLRTWGWWSPVRGAYEASRRLGGHRMVFDRLARPRTVPKLITPHPVPGHIPDTVADATRLAAREIVAGTVTLFGRKVEVGEVPDWHAVIDGVGSWPIVPWWEIDISGPGRSGDVKWAWELGRHRHLVILARAVHLDGSDSGALPTLERHLRSWLEVCPPERGIHWYSTLEIALRALAWLEVLALAGDRLAPDTVAAMTAQLHHSGRHIMADLPMTLSSARNNHLVGDSVGLVALGRAFPGDRAAGRWVRLGDRLLSGHISHHVATDGSSIEDSLGYRRFVLELLARRALLGQAPPEVTAAMTRAARHLARLGVLDGPVPQFGDWDGGRALASTGDGSDTAGSVLVALALVGRGARPAEREARDDVAWYVPDGEPVEAAAAETGGGDAGGGVGRVARGELRVWLKAGSAPSHGHADLTSCWIRYAEHWLVGDPGTGTYNGPIARRTYFRTSVAHPVVRVGGLDQREPYRTFRWRYAPTGRLGEPLHRDEATIMWAVHDAYRRLPEGRRVARACVVEERAVTVVDWVEGAAVDYSLSLPLHPAAAWDGTAINTPGGDQWALLVSGPVGMVEGSQEPYDGWWSDDYGEARPAVRLAVEGTTRGPQVWELYRTGGPAARVGEDEAVAVGDLTVRLSWEPARAVLLVDGPGGPIQRTVAL